MDSEKSEATPDVDSWDYDPGPDDPNAGRRESIVDDSFGANWYVMRGAVQTGPLTHADVRVLLKAGRIAATDSVWYPSSQKWRPAKQATPLATVFTEIEESRFSSRRPRLYRALIALAVIAVVVWGAMSVQAFLGSGFTRGPDNTFGDQHLKTMVALLELHKVRYGSYPARLRDLKFLGEWDQLPLTSVRYVVSKDRQHYYVDVTRGWIGKPTLSYPPEFWRGTGYDPALAPSRR